MNIVRNRTRYFSNKGEIQKPLYVKHCILVLPHHLEQNTSNTKLPQEYIIIMYRNKSYCLEIKCHNFTVYAGNPFEHDRRNYIICTVFIPSIPHDKSRFYSHNKYMSNKQCFTKSELFLLLNYAFVLLILKTFEHDR